VRLKKTRNKKRGLGQTDSPNPAPPPVETTHALSQMYALSQTQRLKYVRRNTKLTIKF
jgi:hypothetical protein